MNRTGLTGVPLTSTWKCRCNPVLVPVEPSMPSRCPILTRAPGTDVAVDVGQVPVAGDDAVAVAKGNDVAVIPVPKSAERRFRQRRQPPAPARGARRGLGRCAAATPYIWDGNGARTAR